MVPGQQRQIVRYPPGRFRATSGTTLSGIGKLDALFPGLVGRPSVGQSVDEE